MDFISTKEAANKWGIGERRVQFFCSNGKINGAVFIGRQWMIPSDATRPIDGRSKASRQNIETEPYHFPVFIFSRFYTNSSLLSENELLILKAQTMYLEGRYLESISTCRKVLNEKLTTEEKVGVYITLAYCYLPTGLYVSLQECIKKLQQIVDSEILHKEDYKLILYALRNHASHKLNELYSLDINSLSPEAFDYFHYVALIMNILSRKPLPLETLMLYETLCKKAELENNLPLALALHTEIGTLSLTAKNNEKMKYHINEACKIAIKNNWLNYLSKFYFAIRSIADECINNIDPQAIPKLMEIGFKNQTGWKLSAKIAANNTHFKTMNPVDYEILSLISLSFSIKEMSSIYGKTEEQVETKIDEIQKKLNIQTREELIRFSENEFSLDD